MDTAHLAQIIAGEAGLCGPLAMLAVYYIHQRNQRMLGYSTAPTPDAIFIASVGHMLPDPVRGKRYLFSEQDLRLSTVQQIINSRPPPTIFFCAGGLKLYAY